MYDSGSKKEKIYLLTTANLANNCAHKNVTPTAKREDCQVLRQRTRGFSGCQLYIKEVHSLDLTFHPIADIFFVTDDV